ncbi:MAG: type II toxin-antitoxin system Phd/YefM family antitoxin [Elusimicrobia bacterium]|nr:type II toxin-antitoxin system Phd/YefM family antitoxin [Candidatus Liberimonas magnetica]
MNYVQFTKFRNHSKEYFDGVQHGNAYVVIRKGKPIAQVLPFDVNVTGWKRKINKVGLKKDVNALDYVLKERNEK